MPPPGRSGGGYRSRRLSPLADFAGASFLEAFGRRTLGPARTPMSALAVRRSTLYRHFPDEAALFGACSAHWAAENPPPDITLWERIDDPDERLAAALEELYAYYRRAGGMIEKLLRDEATVPVVAELLAPYHQFLKMAGEILMRGRGLHGKARTRTRAAVGHALAFSTWQELTAAQGLANRVAASLMVALCAVAPSADPQI